MKLAQLYERDIDRRIDPVATVSELESDYIEKEISEYYFTDTLIRHLDAVLRKISSGTSGRTGVWINGYYGSGKSHFLKYIYYCLNPEHREKALDHYQERVRDHGSPLDLEVTPTDVTSVRRNLQEMEVETIMFNIKNVAGQEENRQTVTRTFLNRLNHLRGYNKANRAIARFEKHLQGKGLLKTFKKEYQKQTGDDWSEKANDAIDYMLEEVLDVAQRVDPDLDRASTRQSFVNPGDFSTEQFVDELERYLATRPEGYRLVYLVDEVSQYMEGKVDLLLDLQTIVEEIGSRLGDKVWVICTAQQDLSELVEGTQRKQDATYNFGKIMGRFQDNFLPLESQEADTITKKRVLEKSSTGRAELRSFYDTNEMPLTHQFEPEHDLYQGYRSFEDFRDSYPFVPYQFKLILDVIQSFVSAEFLVAGVSGTERSLLGVTHLTAKNCKDQSVGYVVPFDEFYNNQISANLTHRARNIVSKAERLERVKQDTFYLRVVKVLFLLSNVTEDRQATFPATTENLALVMLSEVDQNKNELQQRVQEVLDYLLSQNVISAREGAYRFLQEEEVRVRTEISNFNLTTDERLRTFKSQIIEKTLAWSTTHKLEGSTVRFKLWIDELAEGSGDDVEVELLVYDERNPETLALEKGKTDLVLCLHEVFDAERRRQFYDAAQIQSFVSAHSDRATGKRRDAMDTFSREAKRTFSELRDWFAEAFASARYISAQQVKEVGAHNGADPKTVYNRVLEDHLNRVYSKRSLATSYAGSKDEVKAAAGTQQQELSGSLTPAETEVESKLKLMQRPVLQDVIRTFSRPPYGWKDTEVIDILLSLNARNRWAFRWNSEDVGRTRFAEQAMNSRERSSLTLYEQEPVDTDVMEEVVQAVNDVFNEQVLGFTTDPRRLATDVRQAMQDRAREFRNVAQQSEGYPFRRQIDAFAEALDSLTNHRQPARLFDEVLEQADTLRAQGDDARSLRDFLEQKHALYEKMRRLVRDQKYNFQYLSEPHDRYASQLVQYVQEDEKPHHRLPEMKEFYGAVSEKLEELQDEIRAEVLAAYEEAYDELERKKDELDVETNVLPAREKKLGGIRKALTIAELENQKQQVQEFETEYLLKLRNQAAKEQDTGKANTTFNVLQHATRRELETEEDVHAFVDDLREKLLAHVRDDTIVIIS